MDSHNNLLKKNIIALLQSTQNNLTIPALFEYYTALQLSIEYQNNNGST